MANCYATVCLCNGMLQKDFVDAIWLILSSLMESALCGKLLHGQNSLWCFLCVHITNEKTIIWKWKATEKHFFKTSFAIA